MPLKIVRNDITKMQVDAIVNPANGTLLGGGGTDGAIHAAAGPGLLAECRTLGGCRTGDAKITGGYDLPCKYVIHTVGPQWRGGFLGEKRLLRSCYRTSLELARERGCESIAFPLISSGICGYPKDKALAVAMDTIYQFLAENEMQVYLVVFDRSAYQISSGLFQAVQAYIDDHYVQQHEDLPHIRRMRREQQLPPEPPAECSIRTEMEPDCSIMQDFCGAPMETAAPCRAPKERAPRMLPKAATISRSLSLDDALNQIDESFSQMVLRKIREKGMKNADCYKRANLDKKLFSKLANDIHYKPKKTTAVALAMALQLPLPEARELLMKAGFALSHSDKFDIIVEFFIINGKYDIFEINEVLFHYDQPLLGSVIF